MLREYRNIELDVRAMSVRVRETGTHKDVHNAFDFSTKKKMLHAFIWALKLGSVRSTTVRVRERAAARRAFERSSSSDGVLELVLRLHTYTSMHLSFFSFLSLRARVLLFLFLALLLLSSSSSSLWLSYMLSVLKVKKM